MHWKAHSWKDNAELWSKMKMVECMPHLLSFLKSDLLILGNILAWHRNLNKIFCQYLYWKKMFESRWFCVDISRIFSGIAQCPKAILISAYIYIYIYIYMLSLVFYFHVIRYQEIIGLFYSFIIAYIFAYILFFKLQICRLWRMKW